MTFEVGKAYKTVGGWKALVIWEYKNSPPGIGYGAYIAIHFIDVCDKDITYEHSYEHDSIGRVDAYSLIVGKIAPHPIWIPRPGDLTEEEWKDDE